MIQFLLCAALSLSFAITIVSAEQEHNRIPDTFVDTDYRIERGFVHPVAAANLLEDLLFHGVPTDDEEVNTAALKKIGDAGQTIVDQYATEQYTAALQNFTKPEHHMSFQHSLVYYLEQLDGPSRERTNEIVSNFAAASILEDDTGTAHVYLSAPGMAALDNHTDTTDIVVLQLDGAKEWTLCTAAASIGTEFLPQDDHEDFDKKLNSCSTYHSGEMEALTCERTILHPGDVLFLPRRVVHSARALQETFSAHLTIGYKEEEMCYRNNSDGDFDNGSPHVGRRRLCDGGCDECCDGTICSCDESCDDGCDYAFGQSCDSSCDSGCDQYSKCSCNCYCDASCDWFG